MKGVLKRVLGRGPADAAGLTYEESREIARHPDPDVRRRLARRTDVRPEILYFLAEDKVPAVRREIATNDRAPAHANVLLARDGDADVRCDMAQKIGRLMPELSEDERDRVRALTLEALDLLARDQMTRVRQALSEALKDAPNVPHDVVMRLARDEELPVSAPILEFSPLLTDDDLLEIISSPVVVGALSAISRRARISEGVADVIAASDDADAVAALLANPSAQIREETLDELVEGARRVAAWRMPLAERPKLPMRCARKLASFVTDTVLAALMRRSDLDPETAEMVSEAVRERMAPRDDVLPGGQAPPARADGATSEASDAGEGEGEAERRRKGVDQGKIAGYVQRLYAKGELTEARIDEELIGGNRSFVTHALALKAGLPSSVVSRIASARSAKAMTALAWKAGLRMRFAIKLQARFANVPSREVIQARDGIDYPMSEEDMKWQLDFYAS